MSLLRQLLLSLSFILGVAPITGCDSNITDVCIQYQANWCGPCHAQEPAFEAWGESHGVHYAILDITNDLRARAMNGIVSYPTYIYYRNGVEIYRTDHVSKLYVPE